MTEMLPTQFNSKLSYPNGAMCNLDTSSPLKYSKQQAAISITGKKIITEMQVNKANEHSPPCKIFEKSHPREKSFANRKHLEKKPKSKTKESSQKDSMKYSENLIENKKGLIRNIYLHPKPRPGKEPAHSKAKSHDIEHEKKLEKAKPPYQTFSSKFKALIKATLKKAQINKLKAKKAKKGLEEIKQLKKSERLQQNAQIRKENQRFTKKHCSPPHSWRMDELNPRHKSAENSTRKTKSSERVQTGLDIIRKVQAEIGIPVVTSTNLSQRSNNEKSARSNWKPNPAVLAYMQKKKLNLKKSKIFDNLHKCAEESSKAAQMNNLKKVVKATVEKDKQRKVHSERRGKPEGEIDYSQIQEEYKNLDLVYRSDSNCLEEYSDSKRTESRKERMHTGDSIGMKEQLWENDKKSQKKTQMTIQERAAILIQSVVRRFLVQRRIEREQECLSVDEQIIDIINRGNLAENLSSTPQFEESISKSKQQKYSKKPEILTKPEISYPHSLTLELPTSEYNAGSSSFSEPRLTRENENQEKAHDLLKHIEEKNIEYQQKLKEQVILREAQIKHLSSLKEKEKRNIQLITEKVGNSEELSEILRFLVEKRYNQLAELFRSGVKGDEDLLIGMNIEEKQEFKENIEDKKQELSKIIEKESRALESYIDDFISHRNLSNSPSSEENRPVICKTKSQLSMLSADVSEIQHVPEAHFQAVSILSRDSAIHESALSPLLSDNEIQESFELFVSDN